MPDKKKDEEDFFCLLQIHLFIRYLDPQLHVANNLRYFFNFDFGYICIIIGVPQKKSMNYSCETTVVDWKIYK